MLQRLTKFGIDKNRIEILPGLKEESYIWNVISILI